MLNKPYSMRSEPVRAKRQHLICLLAGFLLVLPVQAQEAGLSFLRLGTDAAALALGEAHVAHSRDAWATYWNPAGLAAAASGMAALSHHLWIAEVRTYALAARLRAGTHGGLGLFVTAAGHGDAPAGGLDETENFFNPQFISAGVSYGHQFGPLRAGGTVKYLGERIDDIQRTDGVAVDLGLQADLFGGTLQLGTAVQHLGWMNRSGPASTPLPRTFRVGAAVFPLRIFAAADDAPLVNTFLIGELSHVFPDRQEVLEQEEPEHTRLHLGVAAEVVELVILRAGLVTRHEARGFSFGGGLGYGAFHVDYAYVPFESGFADAGHILTLAYRW